jgi:hypothetical protein
MAEEKAARQDQHSENQEMVVLNPMHRHRQVVRKGAFILEPKSGVQLTDIPSCAGKP